MSLKAKIEAVIYASEEPVTLQQLMGLLGEEAQLELDAREAEQPSLALDTDVAPEDGGEGEPSADAEASSGDAAGSAAPPDAETPTDPATGDDVSAEAESTLQPATPENVEAATAAVASTKQENARAVAAEARARERKLRVFFRELLDDLIKEYATGDRGLEVREVAGGFRLATKPEYHDAVRGFVKQLKPPLKLSLQALETLAVVAYKQPVTAPEVSEIRGVDSAGVLGSLMSRKLVQTAGRKQVIGRPMLYKTSKEFLVRFGLKDINELPSIEEFERMAGELNDAVQEEIPMDGDAAEGEPRAASEDTDDEAPDASTEETMSDRSNLAEGAGRERADVESAAREAEPMADVHEGQADGVPDVNPADNIVVDGRIVGGPHTDRYDEDATEDSPEMDAEVQRDADEAENV